MRILYFKVKPITITVPPELETKLYHEFLRSWAMFR